MSLNRWGKQRDKSEPGIVGALQLVGAEVYRVDTPCDLIVWFRERVFLMECKTIHKGRKKPLKDKRQVEQAEFLALTKTPIVTNPDEALRVIGAIT